MTQPKRMVTTCGLPFHILLPQLLDSADNHFGNTLLLCLTWLLRGAISLPPLRGSVAPTAHSTSPRPKQGWVPAGPTPPLSPQLS